MRKSSIKDDSLRYALQHLGRDGCTPGAIVACAAEFEKYLSGQEPASE